MNTSVANERLQSVLQVQQEIDACDSEVEKLNKVKAKQVKKIDQLKQGLSPDLDDLRRQRQFVAASVSLGKATQAQLDQADKKVADAEEAAKAGRSGIASAQDIVDGIDMHIAGHEAQKADLVKQHATACRALLAAEIDSAGAEYAELALKTAAVYAKLAGLIMLSGSHVPVRGEICLPSFELESVKAIYPGDPVTGALFPRAGWTMRATMEWSAGQRQRLSAMGVRLPSA